MELKYFGILLTEMYLPFLGKNLKEQMIKNKLLVMKTYAVNYHREEKNKNIITIKTEFDLSSIGYYFSSEVGEEVYSFLIDRYSFYRPHSVTFTLNFKDKVFGLSKKNKAKVALEEFNFYFNKLTEHSIVYSEKDNKNGKIKTPSRFKRLDKVRQSMIENLRLRNEITTSYLSGDYEFFSHDLAESNEWLNEILVFEDVFSILVELNNEFHFEGTEIQNKYEIAQKIFEEMRSEFGSLEVLQFIEQQINEVSSKPAFVSSLFTFLKNKKNIKIPSAEKFTEILNQYFLLELKKIKGTYEKNNMQHKKRIKVLNNDWDKFPN